MLIPHRDGYIDTDSYYVVKQVDGSYTCWSDGQEEPYVVVTNGKKPSCTCPWYLWTQKSGQCQKHKKIVDIKIALGEVEEVEV